MSEKTETATAYKLKKAKEKGQVSKSSELINTTQLAVILLLLWLYGTKGWQQMLAVSQEQLHLTGHLHFSLKTVTYIFKLLTTNLLYLWLPFALILVATTIVCSLVQTGFVWSAAPLSPRFERIGPVAGFKRLFSTKIVFDLLKNLLKIALTGLIGFYSLRQTQASFLKLSSVMPAQLPMAILQLMLRMLCPLVVVLLAISLIDKLYTRRKFAKEQRMSKQEVKEEYRQREGDPKIKSRIRQLQSELRKRSASFEQVKTADLVITNPTHYAIALKYDRLTMPAPKLICKGRNEQARIIKKLALRHQIPLVENKAFARRLYASVDLNQWIRREHFPAAAAIYKQLGLGKR
ncbi:EscU/YscU/HrcU family type III secretion system export apparatus switch protein [Legionella quinlivanii]|uniref:EscU/YscU/HrcU family type III secretion system export apparatus switch protein n=1 Tax=Legionella quinlivanii TaxID=45073 RepID=UPI002243BAD9|nr:EscU/YscU/HrcU family type III secretion system export apparatus switch protein [Legionella quinlivanii]MCW8451416.1 EscU/YscU/HrcU family type III secretion system export apparatus switch protein [Legionella quinlivanii]